MSSISELTLTHGYAGYGRPEEKVTQISFMHVIDLALRMRIQERLENS